MTREEKELLLKDLCARLPYGVICDIYDDTCTIKEKLLFGGISHFADDTICVKPYLRPISSMTKEEKIEYGDRCYLTLECISANQQYYFNELYDWLLKHHFDYRGLIEKGLALEAPKGMYEEE